MNKEIDYHSISVYLAKADPLSLLAVNPGLIIWTFIIFSLVFLILRKFAWQPIAQALDQRAAKIAEEISNAEKLEKNAQEKSDLYEEKIKDSVNVAERIIDEKRKEAEILKKKMIADTHNETAEMLKNAKKEIERAKQDAQSEIQKVIVRLSVQYAAKIIGREIKPQDHAEIFQESLAKVQKFRVREDAN